MKNIGTKLKDKREENGLSIEEVSQDLKMRPSQISSIEEGKIEDFKDVFYLKYFIKDYAKYLGLDSDRILDDFNEYLFDRTSKIPIDLIEKAKNEKKNDEEVASPYTKENNNRKKFFKWIVSLVVVIIVIILCYVIFSIHKGNDFSDNNITYSIRR